MRILLTGTSGQLGRELKRSLAVLGSLICLDRSALDLSKPSLIKPFLDECRPNLIVNPAAYTAVDKAQSDAKTCWAVNAQSPGEIARWCAQHDVGLIQYSTDYVYSGMGNHLQIETERTEPVNEYGQSKLAGEEQVMSSGAAALVLRTSWVYDSLGKNFLNTMLRLADSMPELKVVDDQIGAPTHARMLADATLAILARTGTRAADLKPVGGLYNLANEGAVSWHGFALEIMRLRTALSGLAAPEVKAIPSKEFPTPAARPANSRLALKKVKKQFDLALPDWQESLEHAMNDRLRPGATD